MNDGSGSEDGRRGNVRYMPRRWFLTDKGRAVLGLGPAPTAETVGVPMFDPIPDDVLAWVDRRKLAEDRVAMQDAS